MPRDIDGLIDDIDRLVDEQLASGPVDDYNTNRYDRCPHCNSDWHGFPLTESIHRMRSMRAPFRLRENSEGLLEMDWGQHA